MKDPIKPQNAPENIEWNPNVKNWMALIHVADNGEETWHYWNKHGYLYVKMRYDSENNPIEIIYFPPDDEPENSLYSASYDRWITFERLEAIKEAKNVDKNALYNPVTEEWILPKNKEEQTNEEDMLLENNHQIDKHNAYLENLGFRQCTQQDIKKLKKEYPHDIELDCFEYIYEGDLILDEFKIETEHIIVTGDFILNQPTFDVDEACALAVYGETKVQYIQVSGRALFYGGITFKVLDVWDYDEQCIYNPQGIILMVQVPEIKNFDPNKVKVFWNNQNREKSFGDATKFLKKDYFEYIDDNFMTFEEYKAKNGDCDYIDYVVDNDVYIDSSSILRAVQAGKKVFLD